jgi:pteridine reductase
MDLDGRVALVTGAGRRVGRAIALRLAQAGCQVAVHYLNSETEARAVAEECGAAGVEAEVFRADLADAQAAHRLPEHVLARFGRLDVLVNNAAVFEPMTVDGFNQDEWDRTLRINLTAPMLLAHAARDALREARGRVINLGDAAVNRPRPDYLAYVVSKGALDTLTRALARALAPEVSVLGIAPGVAAWPESYDEQTRTRLTARIPLGRAGTPQDIAATVHALLTTGDYITGSIVSVDGGRHLV